ncbi:MAG: haloacid dehalogenase-like hydrolase, partial [Pseudomonadota bacterium]|nr:haloacid dehalogenase-like hydrolase [Pseudomonadota bacterium]
MSDLAIYDLDRTITRRATYTPFLIHCAVRRQQWRLLLVPIVVLAMLSYLVGAFDRGKLKEICQALLIGRRIHASDLKPLAESFAEATVASNIRPGARQAIDRDRGQGRRLVLATASYRLYANEIA